MISYLIAIAVGLFETAVTVFFCKKGMNLLFIEGDTASELSTPDEKGSDNKTYTKSQSIALTIICGIVYVATSIFLINETGNHYGFIKLSVVLSAVIISAIIDYKLRIIPNIIILIAIGARLIVYLFEIIYCNDVILEIVKSDLIGFAIGFGLLFIAHLISKSSIGMGDAKLFAVIGICSGAICTYTTLLLSLIINSVVSIVLIITKKRSRKDAIPYAPAICVGYLVTVFIASF